MATKGNIFYWIKRLITDKQFHNEEVESGVLQWKWAKSGVLHQGVFHLIISHFY